MNDVVIRTEGLGKKYVIGHEAERERYQTLRDMLARQARGLARSASDIVRGRPLIMGDEREEFWALKDVSFDVRRGEVVGIIGRNGAGKSTLLKVLSRITEPTEGRVTIEGRVASLLEVGTGFHPELSGRENIYLNGAILGMTRAEIRRKFDEIVAFAGVEQFLDTPVKRYSSGMYVRLAFAVAAHLEPEILIVDEVLAVGDAEFQKKCLGKMQDVAGHGRTVLFVSHNMTAVRHLCTRAVLLDAGTLHLDADATRVVNTYLTVQLNRNQLSISDQINSLPDDQSVRIRDVKIRQNTVEKAFFSAAYPIDIAILWEVRKKEDGIRIYFDLLSFDGQIIWRSFHDERYDEKMARPPGLYRSEVQIPADILASVDYRLVVHATVFRVRGCTGPGIVAPLSVTEAGDYNHAYPGDPVRGILALHLRWQTEPVEFAETNAA